MKRWPTKPLGELCDVEGGNAAPQDDKYFKDGTIPFVRMKDLGRYHFTNNLCETDDKLTEAGVVTNRMKFFDPGCILFPRSGSVALNHRAILGLRACIVSHIGVLQNFRPEITSEFLYNYLTTFDMTALSKKTTGVDSIAFADVKRISVPVPPLAEQERIVKLLDEADELRKLRAQSDRRAAALIPALFHEMFGDPTENSKNHPVLLLKDVCNRITDGTHQPPPFSQEGIPFLFVRNIVKGCIDFETEKFITNETFDELTRRVRPERRDILYSTVGSYGVAVEVQTDRKFAFQRHIGHLKPNHQKVDSGFLTAQLNAPFVKRQADERARGIAQKTVNLAEIREFKVLVPPLPLQKEFAKRVTEIRGMESAQSASRKRLDDLFQSLLHRAFEGEL